MTPGDLTAHRPPKLPSLTGLRFFAALLVFGFHTTLSASPIPPNDPINPFADPTVAAATERVFVTTGYIGVSFFFVLSGFLLAWSARPGESMTLFWRRRIVKIFPNHLVMWTLSMTLFAAAITPVHASVLNLFLLSAYSPDGAVNVAVNPPSWTLCVELLFYLLFPLLILGIRRIPGRRLWFWAAMMVAGMVLVQIVNLTLIPDTPRSAITPVSSYQFWFGYIFPPSRLFEFVLGSILARVVVENRWPAFRAWHVLLACAVGYALVNAVPFVWTFNVATIIPIAMLIATVAAGDAAGRERASCSPGRCNGWATPRSGSTSARAWWSSGHARRWTTPPSRPRSRCSWSPGSSGSPSWAGGPCTPWSRSR